MNKEVTVVSPTDRPEIVAAVASGKTYDEIAAIKDPKAVETPVSEAAAEEVVAEKPEESDPSKPEEGNKPKKNGFKKRIDKLNLRVSERDREIENLRAEIAASKVAKPLQSDVIEPKKIDATGRPDPDKFDTHDQYIEALTDWKTDQKLASASKKSEEDKLKADHANAFKTKLDGFTNQAKDFAKKTADYQKTLDSVDDIEMSETVRDSVLEGGPELAYALAKSPDEFEKICSMPRDQALKALAVFEFKIKSSAETVKPGEEKREAKQKPAPLSTIGGRTQVSKDPGEMSYEEYKIWWAETHGKKTS